MDLEHSAEEKMLSADSLSQSSFVVFFFALFSLFSAFDRRETKSHWLDATISGHAWPTVEYLSDRTFQTSAPQFNYLLVFL